MFLKEDTLEAGPIKPDFGNDPLYSICTIGLYLMDHVSAYFH